MPQGSCLCGHVKYEYDQAAMKAICHCLTCRKLSGSAFATTVLIPDAGFRLVQPSADGLKVAKTIHESGMTLKYSGCAQCGSILFKTADGFPGSTIVFAGTLDKKNSGSNGYAVNGDAEVNGKADSEDIETEGAPHAELWIKYRVPWLRPVEGDVKQFEEFPPHA